MTSATDSAVFEWPVRVYVEDTDAGGIVFYANYLKFFERARTEWVRSLGIELRGRLEEGISFVVQRLNLQYHQPAYLDDQLAITAELQEVRRSYMTFRQRAFRAGCDTCLVEADVRVACVQLPSGRPRRLPPDLANALEASLNGSQNSNS